MERFDNIISWVCITAFTAIATFFDSTLSFLVALLIGFTLNIFAGFRADKVKLKLHRVFPPLICFQNFSGNKFKDSLFELFLITGLTYFIKGIIVLFKFSEFSDYAVQWLLIIAVYYYFRNALRNLTTVYPDIKWIKMLYVLIAFKFRELAGGDIADIVEQGEKNQKIIDNRNKEDK